MNTILETEKLSLDLHKMSRYEAREYLDLMLSSLPHEIREVTVIHGHHKGSVLLDMVRRDYRHSRISKKFVCMNPGITCFLLS